MPGYTEAGLARSTPGCTLTGPRGACRDIPRQEGRAGAWYGAGAGHTPGRRPWVPARACGSRCPPVVPGAAAPTAGPGLGVPGPWGHSGACVWGAQALGGLRGRSVPRPAPRARVSPGWRDMSPSGAPGSPPELGGFAFVSQDSTSPRQGGLYLLGLRTALPPGLGIYFLGFVLPPRLSFGSRAGPINLRFLN